MTIINICNFLQLQLQKMSHNNSLRTASVLKHTLKFVCICCDFLTCRPNMQVMRSLCIDSIGKIMLLLICIFFNLCLLLFHQFDCFTKRTLHYCRLRRGALHHVVREMPRNTKLHKSMFQMTENANNMISHCYAI